MRLQATSFHRSFLPQGVRFGQQKPVQAALTDVGTQLVQELVQHPNQPSLMLVYYLTQLNTPAWPAQDKQDSLKSVLTALFKREKSNPNANKAKLHVASLLVAHVTRYHTYFDAAVQSSVANACMGLSGPAIDYLTALGRPYGQSPYTNEPWYALLKEQNQQKDPVKLAKTIVAMIEETHQDHDPEEMGVMTEAINMLCTHVDQFGPADMILDALQRCSDVQLSPHVTHYLKHLHKQPPAAFWQPNSGRPPQKKGA